MAEPPQGGTGPHRTIIATPALHMPVLIEYGRAAGGLFIEVQHGEYFSEDDIERLDDDHGQVS
ncbi:MAG: hypothetical protein ACRD6W_16230 [Nitrososphaerales archaeon]